ncbi:MAG: DUF1629 domain-containing protein [Hyphomicrobiaceae bacterium]
MGLVYQFRAVPHYESRVGKKIIAPRMEDLSQVKFLDPERVDQVSKMSSTPALQGYPVDPTTMPTAVVYESKNKAVPDVEMAGGGVEIVSERVRDVIEQFEPGVHQFLPVDVYRPKANEPFTRRYWMIVCRRIDSVDAAHSTITRRASGIWNADGQMVMNLSAIGSAHLWCDPFIGPRYHSCSQSLCDALKQMSLTGVSLDPREAV